MAIEIKKETLITGTQAYSLVAGDKIQLKVKDEWVLNYEIPSGKSGTLSITLDGKLLEP